MTIETAIQASIENNCIAHLEVEGDLLEAMCIPGWAGDYDYTYAQHDVALLSSLAVWGTDDDGNEWRIQLHTV